jgi:uncharacterized membrane protein
LTETAIEGSGASLRTISQAPSVVAGSRLREVDMWRGLVIALMALDHARDFFHSGAFLFNPLDPERTNAALYATRWITHLCAPSFVFLAGVSAYLQAAKGKPTSQLSRFLLTRGLWLVVIEVTVISFSWAFALPYPLLLQVIWAIGWSMIALSLLVWLPPMAVLGVGIAIVAGHNLLDAITPGQLGNLAILWTFLHEGGRLAVAGQPIGYVSYPVLPWVGVMAVGYGLGALFLQPAQQRDRMLPMLGGAMIALFVLLRGFDLYGDPDTWIPQPDFVRSAMAFLDVQKYPPSLMFVLVTLGLGFTLVPLLSRIQGRGGSILLTYGAVPFFFYVLHLPLIHGLAIAANAALGRNVSGMFNFFVNMAVTPERHLHLGFPLAGVYVAWIVVLALLYPLCRWWMKLKRRRADWWLSYL